MVVVRPIQTGGCSSHVGSNFSRAQDDTSPHKVQADTTGRVHKTRGTRLRSLLGSTRETGATFAALFLVLVTLWLKTHLLVLLRLIAAVNVLVSLLGLDSCRIAQVLLSIRPECTNHGQSRVEARAKRKYVPFLARLCLLLVHTFGGLLQPRLVISNFTTFRPLHRFCPFFLFLDLLSLFGRQFGKLGLLVLQVLKRLRRVRNVLQVRRSFGTAR